MAILNEVLPFICMTDFDIQEEFLSARHHFTHILEENCFKKLISQETNVESIGNHTCNYYDVPQFNSHFKNISTDLSFFHLNIRSFAKNKGQLLVLLSALDSISFDVIVLTEIRHDAKNYINSHFLSNYNIFSEVPETNKCGGAAILVKNIHTSVYIRDDLQLQKSCACPKCQFETLWVEVRTEHISFITGAIYRHPNGNTKHFVHDLDISLNRLPGDTTAIILGDINMDLLKLECGYNYEYITTLATYNFSPQITIPTRLTDHSVSLIDHIFLKLPLKNITTKTISGNIYSDISDHLPNFTVLCNMLKKPNNDRPFVRIISEQNINTFNNNLAEVEWSEVLGNENDVNAMCSNFYSVINKNYNKCFPLVRQSKKRSKDKIWITSDLKQSINRKNVLFRKQRSVPSLTNILRYKSYKNVLSARIKEAEVAYYNSIFSDKQKATINFWKSFGNTINAKKNRNYSKLPKLIIGDNVITNDSDIANGFNDYFCSVGENIAGNIGNSNTNFRQYLTDKIQSTFFMSPVLEPEVHRELRKLQPKKASGPDAISNKIIKPCSVNLLEPLTLIYNTSIITATYPTKWKLAKVFALFKKHSRFHPENYRPISLLDTFGKVFEKLIYQQMMKFIVKHSILFINQYGFRENYSTTLALIDIVDKIKNSLDNNEYAIGIFLDLQKAFDTVNHEILYVKLAHYGFRGHCLKFIQSYLSDRQQYSSVNGCNSDIKSINYGVPQGSVLGPLLFLLYMNDIKNCINEESIKLFADDTAIFDHDSSLTRLLKRAEQKMKSLHSWFMANKLSLSLSKSNFVLFHGKNKKIDQPIDKITFDTHSIPRVNSAKYIGLTLDETLSFDKHVNNVLKSLHIYFGIFYNVRNFINSHIIRSLYYCCIYSRIKYGLEIYGSCSKSLIQKLQVIQNKLLRVIMNKDYRFNTNRLHRELNIFKITHVHQMSVLNFTHNCLHGDPIPTFCEYFPLNINRHAHCTRQLGQIVKKKINTELGRSSTQFTGATLWNDLPSPIRNTKKFPSFKRKLNQFYREQYNDE